MKRRYKEKNWFMFNHLTDKSQAIIRLDLIKEVRTHEDIFLVIEYIAENDEWKNFTSEDMRNKEFERLQRFLGISKTTNKQRRV